MAITIKLFTWVQTKQSLCQVFERATIPPSMIGWWHPSHFSLPAFTTNGPAKKNPFEKIQNKRIVVVVLFEDGCMVKILMVMVMVVVVLIEDHTTM